MEKEAGIEIFEKYEDVNILESLSDGNVLLWDAIMALPYERVLVKMMMNQDKRIYEEQYREVLKQRRNESN